MVWEIKEDGKTEISIENKKITVDLIDNDLDIIIRSLVHSLSTTPINTDIPDPDLERHKEYHYLIETFKEIREQLYYD